MEHEVVRRKKPQKLSEEELSHLAQLDSSLINGLAAWANKNLSCVHCKRCTLRCEVLSDPGLDIGWVEKGYQQITAFPFEEQPAEVLRLLDQYPGLYNALRRCCFCGYCTATCQVHMIAPDRMREWRELFMRTGLMPPDDSKLVMVDNEWHIFSAYRAIYGIAYPEFLSLDDAANQGPGVADTLFFPGCSLVSYAPDLVRKVGHWLTDADVAWAMSDDCCGSPLMSAGLFERSDILRQSILDRCRAAGITKILTVCPGCGEELAEVMGDEMDIVPLPELIFAKSTPLEDGAANPNKPTPLPTTSVTFFDSCHDRFDGRHGAAIRALMKVCAPETAHIEMDHRRKGTLCCGAGGAVASYDDDITQRRVWRIIDEGRATGAQTLITMCPTCTYTIGQACLNIDAACGIDNRHYLELLFEETIDWAAVFSQLESMWTGEYGPWLTETFFS